MGTLLFWGLIIFGVPCVPKPPYRIHDEMAVMKNTSKLRGLSCTPVGQKLFVLLCAALSLTEGFRV